MSFMIGRPHHGLDMAIESYVAYGDPVEVEVQQRQAREFVANPYALEASLNLGELGSVVLSALGREVEPLPGRRSWFIGFNLETQEHYDVTIYGHKLLTRIHDRLTNNHDRPIKAKVRTKTIIPTGPDKDLFNY